MGSRWSWGCQPTGGWDQGPGDPRVGAYSLVGEKVFPGASASPLMDGARSQDLLAGA